jgi:hypothetical protein
MEYLWDVAGCTDHAHICHVIRGERLVRPVPAREEMLPGYAPGCLRVHPSRDGE